MLLKSGEPQLFIIPLKKNAVGMFFTDTNLRTNQTDTKREIPVLSACAYDADEAAKGKVKLKIPCGYLLIISQLKLQRHAAVQNIPSHRQMESLSVHCVLQAKQNQAADFVNMHLM